MNIVIEKPKRQRRTEHRAITSTSDKGLLKAWRNLLGEGVNVRY